MEMSTEKERRHETRSGICGWKKETDSGDAAEESKGDG
jgi:hypothetical protein